MLFSQITIVHTNDQQIMFVNQMTVTFDEFVCGKIYEEENMMDKKLEKCTMRGGRVAYIQYTNIHSKY